MENKMNKIQVFSKKLNAPLTLSVADGSIVYDWVDKGWRNDVWADLFQWLNGWRHGWRNDGGWANGGGGGGCFITTACIEHVGLGDDCDELTTLRLFRDELVKRDDAFREKVLEYYEKAPLIVEKINESEERDIILDGLYVDMIRPCIQLLKQGEVEQAKELYLSYYENLVEEYLD